MKLAAWTLGVLSIAVIGLGPFAYVAGAISLDAYQWASFVTTFLWFGAAFVLDSRRIVGGES